MSVIKATWKDGQVKLDEPAAWPEGHRLVVADDCLSDIDFMTEAEQSDDPDAIESWIQELEALPPVTMTAKQEAEMMAWRRKAKEFNLEAMRQQMRESKP